MRLITLIRGDCLKEMQKLADDSVDMVLCDLPYGTTKCAWDVVIPFDKLWEQYKRIVKKDGAIVLFGSQPFTSKLVCSNLDMFKYSLVWNKNKCGSPSLAKRRPMKTHEDILVFSRGVEIYNPQMQLGTPYFRKRSGKSRCNNLGFGFANSTKDIINNGTRYPKSIINISRDFSAQQQQHPAQKPVPLLEWLIKTYTNEGDVVLDNCMGVGSSMLACLKTNRKGIGIEINDEYFAIAEKRIAEAQKN